MNYYVYILRCADVTLYTGITNDIARRVVIHNSGKGARYTCGRRPVEVVYLETCIDKAHALQRECEIKKLTRKEKPRLIAEWTCVDFET